LKFKLWSVSVEPKMLAVGKVTVAAATVIAEAENIRKSKKAILSFSFSPPLFFHPKRDIFGWKAKNLYGDIF